MGPMDRGETRLKSFNFHLPTKVLFGKGRIRNLAAGLPSDAKSVLVVTDPAAGEKSGALEAVLPQLDGREVGVFKNVNENPSYADIEEGRKAARALGARLVIGIGGGSPMDAAKGIAVLAANRGDMRDYMKGMPLEASPLPVVCIPTTSGTGSEVTPYAVFTDIENRNKGGFSHPGIFPCLSIVDPELTYSMPESLVVNTGLDVLTHALESYLSTESFELNDALALHVVETVLGSLKQASRKVRESMDRMAYASMAAGVAITHGGTILLHIMAYPLTVFHGIPHGRANALLLPRFLGFMREKSWVKEKVGVLDRHFAQVGGVEAFIKDLGVDIGLSRLGIKEEELALFAAKTIIKGDIKITPAPVTEREIIDIFRSSL